MRKYLLYIPTPDGTHRAKLDSTRNFDVCLNAWGEGMAILRDGEANYVFHERGNMWPVVPRVLEQLPREYDAYCFLCDDVRIDTPTLSELFVAGPRCGFDLWQASLTGPLYGWAHTLT